MSELLPLIRNTSRALIVRDNTLLVLFKTDPIKGDRYSLPGGGQDVGEGLIQTLQRECLEEINTSVEVGELLQVAEFYKQKTPEALQHQLEFLFRCTVPDDYQAANGPEPDHHQVDVRWIPFEEIPSSTFSPTYLSDTVLTYLHHEKNIYLGSFHDHSPA